MQITANLTQCRTLPDQQRANCALCRFNICAALYPEELAQLDFRANALSLKRGATLFAQDDPAEYVYSLTAGAVRLYILLPNGRRQIVGFSPPGDFLGLALADHYGFCADAVYPVIASRYSRQALSDFVDIKLHLLRRIHEFSTHELSLPMTRWSSSGAAMRESRTIEGPKTDSPVKSMLMRVFTLCRLANGG